MIRTTRVVTRSPLSRCAELEMGASRAILELQLKRPSFAPQKAKKEDKPAVKKEKVKAESGDEESEGSDDEASAPGTLSKNAEGDSYLLLSNNRRVTVRSFKGKALIDIREVRRGAVHDSSASADSRSLLPRHTTRTARLDSQARRASV